MGGNILTASVGDLVSVTVTSRHVSRGQPQVCRCCALALAVSEAVGVEGSAEVNFMDGHPWVRVAGMELRGDRGLMSFMDAFDNGLPLWGYGEDDTNRVMDGGDFELVVTHVDVVKTRQPKLI